MTLVLPGALRQLSGRPPATAASGASTPQHDLGAVQHQSQGGRPGSGTAGQKPPSRPSKARGQVCTKRHRRRGNNRRLKTRGAGQGAMPPTTCNGHAPQTPGSPTRRWRAAVAQTVSGPVFCPSAWQPAAGGAVPSAESSSHPRGPAPRTRPCRGPRKSPELLGGPTGLPRRQTTPGRGQGRWRRGGGGGSPIARSFPEGFDTPSPMPTA